MGMIQSKAYCVWALGFGMGSLSLFFLYRGLRWRMKNQKPTLPIRGLNNLGSTCYLNSVLQAFAACPSFTEWLANKDDLNRSDFPPRLHTPKEYEQFEYTIIALLYRAILVINRVIEHDECDQDLACRVPNDLIMTLRSLGHRFVNYQDQDALECLQFFLEIVEAEVIRSTRARQRGSLDCILDEDDASEVSGELISAADVLESERLPMPPPVVPTPATNPRHSFSEASSNVSSWDVLYDPKKAVNGIFSKRKASPELNIPLAPDLPFQGLTATVLQCLQCLHKMVRTETFTTVTLSPMQSNLLGSNSRLHVRSLLLEMQKPVIVTYVDCEECSKKQRGKKIKSAFAKTLYFVRLPDILVFHINQSEWTESGLLRRHDIVGYDSTLNMGEIVNDWRFSLNTHWYSYAGRAVLLAGRGEGGGGDAGGSGDQPSTSAAAAASATSSDSQKTSTKKTDDNLYTLKALISHYGDASSGHYITCRRAPEQPFNQESRWVHVSDEDVAPMGGSQHLMYKPYLLFYERVSPKKSKSQQAS